MKLASLNLINTHQFTAMDHKNSYTHLPTFYELVGTMGFQSSNNESVYLHMFPFSLARKAKE